MSKRNLKKNVQTFTTVLRYLKIYRIHFIISLLFTAISVAFMLYIPILVGNAIDLAIGAGRVDLSGIQKILIQGIYWT